MRKIFFIISFLSFLSVFAFPQVKWGKANYRYEKPNHFRHRNFTFDTGSFSSAVTKTAANAYWFFISDLDGDNCPFYPTCSSFFVKASKETNIVQGTLMFFDRFTRDFNLYKRHEHYPVVKNNHFYDPVELYKLDKRELETTLPKARISE